MTLSFVSESESDLDFLPEPDDSQLKFIHELGIDLIAELDGLEHEEMIDELMNLFGGEGCDVDDSHEELSPEVMQILEALQMAA